MTLGAALRHYRKEHNLLQKELAARIGISLKHYALIERGKAHPSHGVLERICETTSISVQFFPDELPPP
jgi:transcriptional regulator with XRE-family HTH domain